MPNAPLLIYDGDCRFCAWWVRYWRRMTGDRVRYAPYQEVGAAYPDLEESDFRAGIRLDEDGEISAGAEAGFRVLARAGRPAGLWCYRRIPGFAAVAEWTYRFIARHRPACHRASRWLWGRERHPAEYVRTAPLILWGLALTYVAAFLSFALQARGLIGAEGILPLADYLRAAVDQLGAGAWHRLPTLFWLDASDRFIVGLCLAGAAAALLTLPWKRARFWLLAACYAAYLSLFHAGQIFTQYQWDILLLEAGFLALWLPGHPRIGVWLARWLLFRFMLFSGAIKLMSGDPAWADLTALLYHFETQPLPTPLAWYAHHLPDWWLKASTVAVFVIELLVPFLYFAPRRPRMLAAWLTAALQVAILLTGNYNFFNILTLVLCLALFDDRALGRLAPRGFAPRRRVPRAVAALPAALLVLLGVVQFAGFFGWRAPAPVRDAMAVVRPFHLANTYGLFAVMTTERPEIIVQGKHQGEPWRTYRFRYKPGEVAVAPTWMIPHQPRLDWQMWFAALGPLQQSPWFGQFVLRLLEGSEPVTQLLAYNPFPDEPPDQLRAQLYRYRFTEPGTPEAEWAWWTREQTGLYMQPVRHPRSR